VALKPIQKSTVFAAAVATGIKTAAELTGTATARQQLSTDLARVKLRPSPARAAGECNSLCIDLVKRLPLS